MLLNRKSWHNQGLIENDVVYRNMKKVQETVKTKEETLNVNHLESGGVGSDYGSINYSQRKREKPSKLVSETRFQDPSRSIKNKSQPKEKSKVKLWLENEIRNVDRKCQNMSLSADVKSDHTDYYEDVSETEPLLSVNDDTRLDKLSNENEVQHKIQEPDQEDISFTCRFCHNSTKDEDDFWEAPCICRGDLEFAHHKCLETLMMKDGHEFCDTCGVPFLIAMGRKIPQRYPLGSSSTMSQQLTRQKYNELTKKGGKPSPSPKKL